MTTKTLHHWLPPFEFNSRRSPVYAQNAMVATSQPLATHIGLNILSQGGNAADAAVAVAAALAVTEPCSTGLGGDAFALHYNAEIKEVTGLNGSGRSPAALTLEHLHKQGFTHEIEPFSALTINVPGACAAWCDLLSRHGSLSLAHVLAPAATLARNGFPVAPITAEYWRRGKERQLDFAENGHEMLLNGNAPRAGEIMRNPNLATTLERIGTDGKKAFYTGEIAERIASVVQNNNGLLTKDDLAAHLEHAPDWSTPVTTTYRGVRLHECAPNGQGLAALIALNILSALGDAFSGAPLSTTRQHYMIEAMRLAFADVRAHLADPEHARTPIEQLLSPTYAVQRATSLRADKATANIKTGVPITTSNTVYFSIIDAHGNACSMVNSNYMGFGTGIVPKGTGFTLHNRGHSFSLTHGHPNAAAPNKRPYHTIIPAMATHAESNQLYASFGVMGAFMQPQAHVQMMVNLLDHHLDPQTSLDLPRFCVPSGQPTDLVNLEHGMPEQTIAELESMGHPIKTVSGYDRSLLFGRGQIILRDKDTGVLCAGSDGRADGMAAGY